VNRLFSCQQGPAYRSAARRPAFGGFGSALLNFASEMLCFRLRCPISARVVVVSQPMTITLKENTQLVVPPSVQRLARLKAGAQLEFKATPGIITIIGKPPVAVGEYTPRQRRIIDARLALADEDVKQGRVYGPFTAKEATRFLGAELKGRARKPKRRR